MFTACAILVAFTSSLAQTERVREAGDCVLVLEDGVLVRQRADARVPLGCTDERGTGRVLDLAPDPAGLVFVAAEHGLFVLGPFVRVLDRMERLEGGPPGAPTSVHVDAARRVWVATDRAVGVLEPSFGWGRTLDAAELPGAGPYRIEARDGALVLDGAGGSLTYAPDAGPPPRVTRLAVDGREARADERLERAPGGELALAVSGEGRGGATYRYRLDGHHVWRELPPDARVPVPDPGRHRLEVIAVDQDLRRSEPHGVELAVSYPLRYEPRFVLTALAVGAALAFATFLVGERALAGRHRPLRALVSTALAVVLVLQVLAGLFPHAKGWPFVGFGMYTRSFARDEVVHDVRLVALRPDGTELVVRPESAGVAVDSFWQVGRPLIDGGEPALRAFLASWRARHPGADVRGLQVQSRRARLTRAGPVAVAPLVLAHYRETDGG